MLRSTVPFALIATALAVSACKDDTTVKIAPPSQDCICARACGVPVVGNAYWINSKGDAVALGHCPPLHDEILYENRARCQCAQAVPGMGTLPQSVPNG